MCISPRQRRESANPNPKPHPNWSRIMNSSPPASPRCGCIVGSLSLSGVTLVAMFAVLPIAPSRADIWVCIPGLVIYMGGCGAIVGIVGTMVRSTRRAATTGAVIMSLPFLILLGLSAMGTDRLRPERMAALALSASVLGALTVGATAFLCHPIREQTQACVQYHRRRIGRCAICSVLGG